MSAHDTRGCGGPDYCTACAMEQVAEGRAQAKRRHRQQRRHRAQVKRARRARGAQWGRDYR